MEARPAGEHRGRQAAGPALHPGSPPPTQFPSSPLASAIAAEQSSMQPCSTMLVSRAARARMQPSSSCCIAHLSGRPCPPHLAHAAGCSGSCGGRSGTSQWWRTAGCCGTWPPTLASGQRRRCRASCTSGARLGMCAVLGAGADGSGVQPHLPSSALLNAAASPDGPGPLPGLTTARCGAWCWRTRAGPTTPSPGASRAGAQPRRWQQLMERMAWQTEKWSMTGGHECGGRAIRAAPARLSASTSRG